MTEQTPNPAETPVPPTPPAAPATPVPLAASVPPTSDRAQAKNPLISGVISFIIPGTGQMVNGQVKKGLVILVCYYLIVGLTIALVAFGSFILALITSAVGGLGACLCCGAYVVPLAAALAAAYDAYRTAGAIGAGQVVPDWFS